MKLFIWFDPYRLNYGGSALYVVARSVKHARKIAGTESIRRRYGGKGDDGSSWISEEKLGEPDFIRDLPCAELYEWQE